MKHSLVIAILLMGLGVITYAYFKNPRIITVTEYVTEEIDENLWVSRSAYLSERDLVRKLRQDSTKFAQELSKTNQSLVQSTEIIGTLTLKLDSLSSFFDEILDIQSKIDTVFVYTYGDSLLAVSARVQLDSVRFRHSVSVSQLRPLKLTVHTTRDDEGVYFYVESNDLRVEEINSFTTLDIPRYKWYHYLGAGIVAGILTWEIIR